MEFGSIILAAKIVIIGYICLVAATVILYIVSEIVEFDNNSNS